LAVACFRMRKRSSAIYADAVDDAVTAMGLKRRTLEDETVCELRLRKPVQQTLASEPGQRELMLDVELVAPLDEPRLNRGDDFHAACSGQDA
jgi:hypothetical protein